jgi:hypothetical protein
MSLTRALLVRVRPNPRRPESNCSRSKGEEEVCTRARPASSHDYDRRCHLP